jgi:hypothetical protein
MIPIWNQSIENYAETIFFFAEYFLSKRGGIILFYLDDLRVQKEIASFVDAYKFTIKLKWIVINSLPIISTKDQSRLVKYVNPITRVIDSPCVCNSCLHWPLPCELLCKHLLTRSSSLRLSASVFSCLFLESFFREFSLQRRIF